MNPVTLISDLRRRGVELIAEGDYLRYRAPRGVLSPELLTELRSNKTKILAELGEGGPDHSLFAQLESDWQAAITRAQEGFARNATRPSRECLETATAMELGLADGTLARSGMTADDIREFLAEIYIGRSTARLTAEGRVILRLVPRTNRRNQDE